MKKFLMILSLSLIITLTACTSESNATSYRKASSEEAKQMMIKENNYIILDVRTKEEYDAKHIPNALLIPDYELQDKMAELLPDKNQLILVYCRSGNRSKSSAQLLIDAGYTNVVDFGGIKTWPYETEKGE